jgi:hypothetical protein
MNANFFTKAALSSLAFALSAGIAMAGTGRLLADGELWNAPRNRPGPSSSIVGGPVRTYVAPATVRTTVTVPRPAPIVAPEPVFHDERPAATRSTPVTVVPAPVPNSNRTR